MDICHECRKDVKRVMELTPLHGTTPYYKPMAYAEVRRCADGHGVLDATALARLEEGTPDVVTASNFPY